MTAIRLLHLPSGRRLIVAGDRVYEDLDDDRGITSCEQVSELPALRAADDLARSYDLAFSIGAVVNGEWRHEGTLTEAELSALNTDHVRESRTALERHLDFFDVDTRDGIISVRENWNGWRRLGYGWLQSVIGTVGSAMVFGRPFSGFSIDIAGIGKKRKRARSGLYDENGEVDPRLRDRCLAEFDQETNKRYGAADRDRAIPQQRALEIITTVANASGHDIGGVSARQFSSLFGLCTRLNHGQKAITANQLIWLLDGSLLYRAASLPAENGRTRLPRAREHMPLLAVAFTVLLAAACAPRLGDGYTWIEWLRAAVPLVTAAVIAMSLPHPTGVERAVTISVGIVVAATILTGLTVNERLVVWAIVALAAVIAIVQQRRPLVQYLVFCRYPLLLALTTMALPFIAAGPAHMLFKSMLALRVWSIAFVALLTALAAAVFVNTASLIAHQASRRFTSTADWRSPGEWIDRSATWLTFAIAAPVSVALILYAESRTWVAVLSVIAGDAAAVIMMTALKAARSHDAVKRGTHHIRRSIGDRIQRGGENVSAGYLADDGVLIAEHAESAAFFMLTLAMYFAGYVLLIPGSVLQPPSLAFVIFMLLVLGWVLPGCRSSWTSSASRPSWRWRRFRCCSTSSTTSIITST